MVLFRNSVTQIVECIDGRNKVTVLPAHSVGNDRLIFFVVVCVRVVVVCLSVQDKRLLELLGNYHKSRKNRWDWCACSKAMAAP